MSQQPTRAPRLTPLDAEILSMGLELQARGLQEWHGFGVAKAMRDAEGAKRLRARGTLYRALAGLAQYGLVTSRWEGVAEAEEGRPRRRLYQVTPDGVERLREWHRSQIPQGQLQGVPT